MIGGFSNSRTEEYAEAGYEAYRLSCKGVSVIGQPIPNWNSLPKKIKEHWLASTAAIEQKIFEGKYGKL